MHELYTYKRHFTFLRCFSCRHQSLVLPINSCGHLGGHVPFLYAFGGVTGPLWGVSNGACLTLPVLYWRRELSCFCFRFCVKERAEADTGEARRSGYFIRTPAQGSKRKWIPLPLWASSYTACERHPKTLRSPR